ncbi:hypothetical protein RHMOL_Rhmol04G0015800 [Rhododendron molle]|uniref:Uncharacterized protein n=1 Tax=Rhododendron molle TaxID=49168 RepID=A0ACC0NY26_RHOML|nr:hypothetical protein RHMOL_Rhmol04G0015800 [Rhododendron molle]
MVFRIAKKTRSKTSSPKLPPGPWKLPLIGNMHQLAISGSLPHHTLREMAGKYGPLMLLKLGEVSTIIVTSPEIAKDVLKTHDIIFAQRPFLLAARIISYDATNIVSSPYGDYWRQMRKICVMELLSSKRVQTFRGIREEEVSNLIRSISQERELPINLSKKIYSLAFGIVGRAAFGKKSKYQEELISIVEEAIPLVAGFTIVDMYPSVKLLEVITGFRRKLEEMSEKLDQVLESTVREHKERKKAESGKGEAEGEDLVDVLLRIQKQGDLEFPLTDDNIKAVLLWSGAGDCGGGGGVVIVVEMMVVVVTAMIVGGGVEPVVEEEGAAFGAKSKYQEEFISVVEEATALVAGFTVVEMYPSVKLLEVITGFRRKLEKIYEKQNQILESVVRDHRERRTTESGKGKTESMDLVDVLLRIQKQGDLEFPLTDDNIKAVLLCVVSKQLRIAKKTRSKTSSPKLPTGPWKLPLIGNMHQLAVSGSLPHHTLKKMAGKYGPLMLLKLGEVSTIIVTSPEIAKEVLKTHDIIFAQRPFLLASRIISYDARNIVSSPYGDYWRQMRKICVMELLSSKRVQTFRGIREEEVSNLIRAAFGKKSKYQEELISIAEEAIPLVAGFTIVDMYPSVKLLEVITGFRRKLEEMSEKLDQVLESTVREHKERKKAESGKGEAEEEDLVDVLLRIQKQGDLEFPLTDDNIKAVLLPEKVSSADDFSGELPGTGDFSAMELQFPSIPLLLSFLLFVFMVFKISKKMGSKTSSPKLPPGPWTLPLIGNMHQLAVSGSLPHHTLRKMAGNYGPLMHLKLGEKIYSLTYGIIGRAAFGAKSKYQEEFVSVAEEATALAAGFTVVDMYPSVKLLEVITGFRRKLEKIHEKQNQILESVVRDHRERRTTESGKGETESEDLVDVLLRIQKQGDLEFPLTDDNIKAVLLVSIFQLSIFTTTSTYTVCHTCVSRKNGSSILENEGII